jgi:hypothetical protein
LAGGYLTARLYTPRFFHHPSTTNRMKPDQKEVNTLLEVISMKILSSILIQLTDIFFNPIRVMRCGSNGRIIKAIS